MPGAAAIARSRRGRRTLRAFVALGAAIVLHAVALLVFRFVDLGAPDPSLVARLAAARDAARAADDRPMEISAIETLSRPDAPTAEERAREAARKKEEEEVHPKGQVVEIARPAIEERPADARFLSEFDSRVNHEKRGPHGRDKAGAPVAATPPPASPPPGAAQTADAARGGRAGARGEARPALAMARPPETGHDGHEVADDGVLRKKLGDGVGRDRPAPPRSASALPRPAGEDGEAGDGRAASAGQRAGAPHPNLSPSREILERAIGAGQGSMDYLKDLDDGDATALNAKKYKFWSFFNRIKRAVAQEWHPDVVYVQHDRNGNVYGVKDRVTLLRVTLRPDGGLVASNVIQSSGVDFLDDEAVEAFRRAQPFANPPKELVEADGQVHFSFGFIFELSGRTAVKVYKYK